MSVSPPDLCQNCGYSKRHSRQRDDEVLRFCANCKAWLCEACRVEVRQCEQHGHAVVERPGNSTLQSEVPKEDGWYPRVPESVYHADPDSLSSSGARLLIKETPEEFRHQQDQPPDPKPQYDFGHAAHKMVLGEGQQIFVLDPAIHGRTKDGEIAKVPAATSKWKAAEAQARESGRLPITKANMDIAQRMAGRVHTNPIAARLFMSGMPEVSGYWHDQATGVRCRFRADWLPDRPGRMICVDYKTALSADPKKFEKSLVDYGYHQQAAWYLDGLREVGIADDAAFLFIVQKKTPPFPVSLVQIRPEDVELGRRQNRRALELYARCRAEKSWPGYGDGIHVVGLPAWAASQIEASLADVV